MDKGEPGFVDAINFRGVEQLRDVDATTNVQTFSHMYRSSFGQFASAKTGRHACLNMGYWCWQNVREHPLDVFKYLRRQEWLV